MRRGTHYSNNPEEERMVRRIETNSPGHNDRTPLPRMLGWTADRGCFAEDTPLPRAA